MGVNYTEIFDNGDKQTHNGAACFHSMGGGFKGVPSSVIYPALNKCTLDEAKFYYNFLEQILDKNLFTYKINDKNNFDVEFKSKGLNRKQALLYLTAFRYIDEFSPCVQKLNEDKNLDTEKLFEKFQEIHHLWVIGKLAGGFGYGAGHSLMYDYKPDFTPLKLKEFTDNLKNNAITQVHNFFKGGQPKPIKVVKEKLKKMEDFWEIRIDNKEVIV
jgi:hypothetical protein